MNGGENLFEIASGHKTPNGCENSSEISISCIKFRFIYPLQ